jgi:hypothetical protein
MEEKKAVFFVLRDTRQRARFIYDAKENSMSVPPFFSFSVDKNNREEGFRCISEG